jgi:hypothetical protein
MFSFFVPLSFWFYLFSEKVGFRSVLYDDSLLLEFGRYGTPLIPLFETLIRESSGGGGSMFQFIQISITVIVGLRNVGFIRLLIDFRRVLR